MPGMNGLELLEKLRNSGNSTPFIMFTGKSREEVAIKALNLGADYYLRKGGDSESQFSELAHIIRKVVHYRETENALRESEENYRMLVEQSLQGLVIIQDKRIVYTNHATEPRAIVV